jgi:hypothetical protein
MPMLVSVSAPVSAEEKGPGLILPRPASRAKG